MLNVGDGNVTHHTPQLTHSLSFTVLHSDKHSHTSLHLNTNTAAERRMTVNYILKNFWIAESLCGESVFSRLLDKSSLVASFMLLVVVHCSGTQWFPWLLP